MNLNKVDSLDIPGLEIYSKLNEAQLLHYNEPDLGIFIAESPIVIERALNCGYLPISALVDEKEIDSIPDGLKNIEDDSFVIYAARTDILKNITGYELTRGMLCAMRRMPDRGLDEILINARRIAVLEDIVNPTNVGAIFRSAAALNIDAILLTRGCADPLYRRAIRVSMGNVFCISWTYIGKDIEDWYSSGVDLLKQYGFCTAAMALSDNSVSISDQRLLNEDKIAIILGNEGQGLSDSTIVSCDYTVKIPMAKGVDSLNVAAASAVAFYQLTL